MNGDLKYYVHFVGGTSSMWQFLKRSLAAFLNAHGFRIGVDGNRGARVLSDDDDEAQVEENRSNNNAREQARDGQSLQRRTLCNFSTEVLF